MFLRLSQGGKMTVSVVIAMYLNMFIGAIVGWFISVVVNSEKIIRLENEVKVLKEELKKRNRTSNRSK